MSHTKDDAANFIYRKLKETRHRVFAVNPNAETVEGDKCHPNLKAIRDGIDAVVVVTRPTASSLKISAANILNWSRTGQKQG